MNAAMTSPLALRTIFRSALEHEALEATVRGVIPEWLRGDLVRTAPAVFRLADWNARHWFDGLGLMFAFRIDPAGRVHFRQRLLESEVARRIGEGRDDTPHFGTPMRRGFFDRALAPIPRSNDNTNVNCKPYGNRLVAMTETGTQHDIDCTTLRSRGHLRYEDGFGQSLFMLAHPQADFARGVVVNVAMDYSVRSGLVVYEHAMASLERRVVAKVGMTRIPYLHSFGLTSKHVVVLGGPFVVRPWRMLWSDKAYADHFHWRPELGTEITRVDRSTGTRATHVAPPMFVFHTINTFEREGETVHDVLAFDDAGIVAKFKVDDLTREPPDLRARPLRLVLRHGIETARVEAIGDLGFEFPSVDYRRFGGSVYRYVFGASNGPASNGYGSAVVRLDVETGRTRSTSERPWVFGEPVFVSRPGAEREGDGVLLSVASHLEESRAALAVLDAETLDVRAWADVAVPIPLGFHGVFVRDRTTA